MDEQVEGQVLDTEAIGAEALAEIKAEKSAPEGKKPWELDFERDHKDLAPKVEEKKEEAPEEVEEKPDVEEQPAETEEKPAEEQPSEEEAKPVVDKKDTAKEEAYIAEYAKRNNITPQEAKEEVGRLQAIVSKYKNDPLEIAKAYRETQSSYDKIKSQSEQSQKQNVNPVVAQILANPKGYVEDMVKKNSAKLLEEFKTENPERALMLTDGAILEELRDKGLANLNNQINQYQTTLTKEAANKRTEYIGAISEADRKYISTIKTQLDKFPDHMIVDKGFDMNHLVSWARGQHHGEELKAEFKRGFEQGQQQKRILGEVGRESSSTKVKVNRTTSAASSLSSYQQTQAKQMFGNAFDNEKDMFDAYIEVTKGRKTK